MAKTQRNLTDISGTIDTTGVQSGTTDNIAFVHEIFETNPKTREEVLAEEAKLQEHVAENKAQQLKDAVIGHSANLAGGDILHILEAQYGISLTDLKADQGRKTLNKRSFGAPTPVAEPEVVTTPEEVVVATEGEAVVAAPKKRATRKKKVVEDVTEAPAEVAEETAVETPAETPAEAPAEAPVEAPVVEEVAPVVAEEATVTE